MSMLTSLFLSNLLSPYSQIHSIFSYCFIEFVDNFVIGNFVELIVKLIEYG